MPTTLADIDRMMRYCVANTIKVLTKTPDSIDVIAADRKRIRRAMRALAYASGEMRPGDRRYHGKVF